MPSPDRTTRARAARGRLVSARLMLVFSPDAPECRGTHEPLEALARALPHVDVIQVRVKAEGRRSGPSPAQALLDWTERVLDVVTRERPDEVPVLVNDRVEVAACLMDSGCAGVHLGADDVPPPEARRLLGPAALLGFSTHSAEDVVRAAELPVDYVGFGPVFATRTKGYERGLGAEAAWIANAGAFQPLFPIGGIDASNAAELAQVGRAAVGSAILAADDPAEVASAIRALLAAS